MGRECGPAPESQPSLIWQMLFFAAALRYVFALLRDQENAPSTVPYGVRPVESPPGFLPALRDERRFRSAENHWDGLWQVPACPIAAEPPPKDFGPAGRHRGLWH